MSTDAHFARNLNLFCTAARHTRGDCHRWKRTATLENTAKTANFTSRDDWAQWLLSEVAPVRRRAQRAPRHDYSLAVMRASLLSLDHERCRALVVALAVLFGVAYVQPCLRDSDSTGRSSDEPVAFDRLTGHYASTALFRPIAGIQSGVLAPFTTTSRVSERRVALQRPHRPTQAFLARSDNQLQSQIVAVVQPDHLIERSGTPPPG